MDRLEVARFSSLPEAELAVGLLRQHGIDALVADREMANSAPHLQIALGGVRITAPDFQIVQARDIVARVRKGEFGDLTPENDEGWMADHTHGKIGELDDSEIHGVLGSMKNLTRILILAVLLGPLAGCLVIMAVSR